MGRLNKVAIPGLVSGSPTPTPTAGTKVAAPSATPGVVSIAPSGSAPGIVTTPSSVDYQLLIEKAYKGSLTLEEKKLLEQIKVEGKDITILQAVEEDLANQAEFRATHTKVGSESSNEWMKNEDLANLSGPARDKVMELGVSAYNSWVDGLIGSYKGEDGSVNLVDAISGGLTEGQLLASGFSSEDVSLAMTLKTSLDALRSAGALGEDNSINIVEALNKGISVDTLKVVLGDTEEVQSKIDEAIAYNKALTNVKAAGAYGDNGSVYISKALDKGVSESDLRLVLGDTNETASAIASANTYRSARDTLAGGGFIVYKDDGTQVINIVGALDAKIPESQIGLLLNPDTASSEIASSKRYISARDYIDSRKSYTVTSAGSTGTSIERSLPGLVSVVGTYMPAGFADASDMLSAYGYSSEDIASAVDFLSKNVQVGLSNTSLDKEEWVSRSYWESLTSEQQYQLFGRGIDDFARWMAVTGGSVNVGDIVAHPEEYFAKFSALEGVTADQIQSVSGLINTEGVYGAIAEGASPALVSALTGISIGELPTSAASAALAIQTQAQREAAWTKLSNLPPDLVTVSSDSQGKSSFSLDPLQVIGSGLMTKEDLYSLGYTPQQIASLYQARSDEAQRLFNPYYGLTLEEAAAGKLVDPRAYFGTDTTTPMYTQVEMPMFYHGVGSTIKEFGKTTLNIGDYGYSPSSRIREMLLGLVPIYGTVHVAGQRGWTSGWTIASIVGDMALITPVIGGVGKIGMAAKTLPAVGAAGRLGRAVTNVGRISVLPIVETAKPIGSAISGLGRAGSKLVDIGLEIPLKWNVANLERLGSAGVSRVSDVFSTVGKYASHPEWIKATDFYRGPVRGFTGAVFGAPDRIPILIDKGLSKIRPYVFEPGRLIPFGIGAADTATSSVLKVGSRLGQTSPLFPFAHPFQTAKGWGRLLTGTASMPGGWDPIASLARESVILEFHPRYMGPTSSMPEGVSTLKVLGKGEDLLEIPETAGSIRIGAPKARVSVVRELPTGETGLVPKRGGELVEWYAGPAEAPFRFPEGGMSGSYSVTIPYEVPYWSDLGQLPASEIFKRLSPDHIGMFNKPRLVTGWDPKLLTSGEPLRFEGGFPSFGRAVEQGPIGPSGGLSHIVEDVLAIDPKTGETVVVGQRIVPVKRTPGVITKTATETRTSTVVDSPVEARPLAPTETKPFTVRRTTTFPTVVPREPLLGGPLTWAVSRTRVATVPSVFTSPGIPSISPEGLPSPTPSVIESPITVIAPSPDYRTVELDLPGLGETPAEFTSPTPVYVESPLPQEATLTQLQDLTDTQVGDLTATQTELEPFPAPMLSPIPVPTTVITPYKGPPDKIPPFLGVLWPDAGGQPQRQGVNYALEAKVSPRDRGYVTPQYEVYSEGEMAVVRAIPEEGVKFVRWQGDVPPGMRRMNPIALSMDQDRHLVAVMVGTPKERSREMPELFVHLPELPSAPVRGPLSPRPLSLYGKKRIQKKWVTK